MIKAQARPVCYLCGANGELLHVGLRDLIFGAPGSWDLRRCTDSECGMAWLDPMPQPDEIGKAYGEYYTHQDAPASSSLFRTFRRAVRDGHLRSRLGYRQGVGPPWRQYLAPLSAIFPGGTAELESEAMFLRAPKPGTRLLDVGCGAGEKLAAMLELGWQTEGVDTDPLAVELARSRGLVVRHGTLPEQGYPSNTFDVIYMSHVIEHVHEPISLLRECVRVLKPGGTFVLLTPNLAGWGHARYGDNWRGLEPPRHLYLFTPQSLARTLRASGFQSSRIRTVAANARYILSMSIALRHARRSRSGTVLNRTLPWRLEGACLQLWERLLLSLSSQAGDEILAISEKRVTVDAK